MKKTIYFILAVVLASTFFINIPASAYESLSANIVKDGDMSSSTYTWLSYGLPSVKEKIDGRLHVVTGAPIKRVTPKSGIQQTKIPVEAGQKYRLTLDAQVVKGYVIVLLGNKKSNWDFDQTFKDSILYTSTYRNGNTYTRDFIAPTTKDFRLVMITNGAFYVDNIKIQKITEVVDTPTTPPTTPTDTALSPFRSDGDYDGNEDHGNPTKPDPLGFLGACQTSPDIWETADFTYAIDQINDVIGKLNTYENANLDPANFRSMYKTLCIDNDKDGDQVYRQGPYYDPADAGNGCLYNDKDDTISNRTENNCNNPLFVKIPWEGALGWNTQNGTSSDPGTPGTTQPPTTTPPDSTPFNPTPHSPDETYPNAQNIDFTLFPTLKFEDYTGKTYYVSTTGNDTNSGESLTASLKTIQKALEKAVDGDKILVRAGTYAENYTGRTSELLNINHSIYLGAYNKESVIVVPGTGGENTKAIGLSGTGIKNTTIDGIKLNNFTRVGIGLYGTGFSNLVFKNMEITMSQTNLWPDATALTFYGDPANPTTPAVNGVLIQNVKATNTNIGISCNSNACNNVKLSNVVINNHKDTSGSSGSDCFAVENGKNIALINLTVTNCGADGIDTKAQNVIVINPQVLNVTNNSIKLWYGGDIINALINDTGSDGIFFGDQGNARIINSVIANHSHFGRAYCTTTSYRNEQAEMHVQIINTIFYQNSSNEGSIIWFPNINGTTRTLDVKNSIFYKVGGNVEFDTNTSSSFTNTAGHNKINVDPGFVNPIITGGDFKLKSTSPGINAGITTEYNFDILNKTRTSGSFDIGVYEM